jgi:NAD(P)-dependent dehydrogenase (short-subunit alcohol dehydrogenase family)
VHACSSLSIATGDVDVFIADLSSQSEVRRLADEVLHSPPRMNVLVNNVGGYWNTRHVTADGLERTFGPVLVHAHIANRNSPIMKAPTQGAATSIYLASGRDSGT